MTLFSQNRARRGATLAVLAALGVSLLAAWRAPFHLRLLKSVPEANAKIAAAPDTIRLWFSETPEITLTTVKIAGPAKAAVALAPVTRRDSAVVVAAVKGKMDAGAYSLTWRTMSKDGHVARGTFTFTVGTAGAH